MSAVLTSEQMKPLMAEVLEWVEKAEELKAEYEKAEGEAKSAYGVVHRDYVWKIQQKIGKLWFYVCGSEDLSPFKAE